MPAFEVAHAVELRHTRKGGVFSGHRWYEVTLGTYRYVVELLPDGSPSKVVRQYNGVQGSRLLFDYRSRTMGDATRRVVAAAQETWDEEQQAKVANP